MQDLLEHWTRRIAEASSALRPFTAPRARLPRQQLDGLLGVLDALMVDLAAIAIPSSSVTLTQSKSQVEGIISAKVRLLRRRDRSQSVRVRSIANELTEAFHEQLLPFVRAVTGHRPRQSGATLRNDMAASRSAAASANKKRNTRQPSVHETVSAQANEPVADTSALDVLLRWHAQLARLAPSLDVAFVAVGNSPPLQILGARVTATLRVPRAVRFEGPNWVGVRTSLPASQLPQLVSLAKQGKLILANESLAFPLHRAWNLSQFSSTSNGLDPPSWPRASVTGSGHALRDAFPPNLYYAWRDHVGNHPELLDLKDLISKLALRSDFGAADNHRQMMFEIDLPITVTRTHLSTVEANIDFRIDTTGEETLDTILKLRNDSNAQTDVRTLVLSRDVTNVRWPTRTVDAGNIRISAKLQAGDIQLLDTAFHQYWSEPAAPTPRAASSGTAVEAGLDEHQGAHTFRRDLPPPSAGAELAGARVVGRWELERAIGSGGYGTVYAARHLVTHHACAVKIMPYRDDDKSTLSERLKRETRASNEVEHPSIVPIVDAGVDDDLKVAYATMEHLRGAPLANSLGRPMSLRTVAKLMQPVVDALTLCHERGIYHRDLSPGNLFVTSEGIVRILDFGLCYLVGRPRVTVSITALGNPEYASPEQLMRATIEPDATTDVWSLGVVARRAC